MSVRIEGRGVRSPVYHVETNAAGFSIRVDDELNPELWFCVSIPWEMVAKWQAGTIDAMEFNEQMRQGLLLLGVDAPPPPAPPALPPDPPGQSVFSS